MSKPLLKFDGTVTGGKFIPDNPEAFVNHVQKYEGQRVVATLKKYRKYDQRSNNQNRYYWGVIVKLLADEWGYPKHEHDRVHNIIKGEFLMEPVEVKGKMLKEELSTSSLTTTEFEDLMSSIRQWASVEFNCYIPAPNEVPFEY